MGLSDELISQFAKITKDNTKTKSETTVYGTTVEHDGSIYVRLDGSELLTPVTTTANTKPDERVTVMIKDHSAVITGNISSPSASSKDVSDVADEITELEIAIADKVDTEELVAEQARIDQLEADNVIIKDALFASEGEFSELKTEYAEITKKLTAAEADIDNLETTKLDASVAVVTYATIENLEATNTSIHNLEATYADFVVTTTDELEAINASIEELNAGRITADEIEAKYATITELDVERGRIAVLESDVGDIDTLIFGSASGSTIQTSFANAVIAQLGNAQIKSAMIESISADKITAGDIITNNVRVMSEDGSLIISDETMQISDDTRVRVQIGKDAQGDYSINIWDADGNLMFSEGGITDSAIKEAIIRDDMVSDTANISAYKLNINSLFEVINGSTNTIKSTQIYLDDESQTLNVAFTSLTSDVNGLSDTVTSQGTQLSVLQGEIESKIWQQDIDNVVDEMSTQYSTLEQDLSNFQSTVGETYATKTDLSNLEIGARNFVLSSGTTTTIRNSMGKYTLSDYGKNMLVVDQTAVISFDAYADNDTTLDCYIRSSSGSISTMPIHSIGTEKKRYSCVVTVTGSGPETVTFRGNTSVPGYVAANTYISNVKVELGNMATDWTIAPEDINTRISNAETAIEQNTNDITLRAKQTEVDDLAVDLASHYYTIEETQAQIQVASEAIQSEIIATYATQSALSTVEQTAISLTTRIENQQIGGRNLVSNSEGEVSFTNAVQSFDLTEYGISKLQNTDVVISFDLYTDEPGAGCDYYLRYIDSDGAGKGIGITPIDSATDSYVRYSAVITTGDIAPTMFAIRSSQYTTAENQSGTATFYVRKIKVELGNMATDWTPAPEDMATSDDLETVQSSAELTEERVTTAESLIQQLSDSIATLVTDGNGESLMVQTENGWTFSTAELQSTVDSTSENLNNLTAEMGTVNSTVNALQQAVDDFGVLNDYVKIGTYEDEPCIELGENDSDFKLIITNTRIMFMEGSGVPAYINNQSLHIKKAVIEEELEQGGFVWKVRSNGNMGLVWKGVIN